MNLCFFSRFFYRVIEKKTPSGRETQERKTGEEPAVAKTNQTCLISRNLLHVEQVSSFDSDTSTVPVNPQLNSKSVCEIMYRKQSQQQRNDVCERSGSRWNQQQDVENQLKRTKLDSHKMRNLRLSIL